MTVPSVTEVNIEYTSVDWNHICGAEDIDPLAGLSSTTGNRLQNCAGCSFRLSACSEICRLNFGTQFHTAELDWRRKSSAECNVTVVSTLGAKLVPYPSVKEVLLSHS